MAPAAPANALSLLPHGHGNLLAPSAPFFVSFLELKRIQIQSAVVVSRSVQSRPEDAAKKKDFYDRDLDRKATLLCRIKMGSIIKNAKELGLGAKQLLYFVDWKYLLPNYQNFKLNSCRF